MQAPQTKRIYQLDPVPNPANVMAGGVMEWEVPIGPNQSMKNVQLTYEQLQDLLGAGTGGVADGGITAIEITPDTWFCSPALMAMPITQLIWVKPDGSTMPFAGSFNLMLLRILNRPLNGATLGYIDATNQVVPIPTNQPGPYIELALSATGPLLQGDPPVLPWRLYGITGNWNAAGTDSTVYVAGLTTKRWASLGWVLDAKGEAQTVQVNVGAKTWAPLSAGVASPQQAVLTALAATSLDAEVAPGMPLDLGRYRLRAFARASGGGGSPGAFSSPFTEQFA